MITSGFPDGVPCMVPGSPAYDSASQIAAISILVALFSRGSSGEGQHIDASAYEGSRVCIHPWPITFYSYADIDERVVHTEDMRLASMSYPVYPCKDGFIRIMPSGPNQWDALVRVLGSPEVLLMPEWRDVYYRIGNADAIFSFVREYTEKYTMVELFELGHREGIPIAPILDVAGFFHNAQTKAREFFVEVDHPVVGKAFYAGPPYKWSRTPPAIRRSAPCLGEHNEEIYCEELGFTRSELEVLKHDGVL